MLFCEGPEIQVGDLPPELAHLTQGAGGASSRASVTPVAPAPVVVEDIVSGPSGPSGPAPITLTSLPAAAGAPAGSLKEAVRAETERVERGLIMRALEETNGNVTQAARKLKISRKSLQTKMKEFGLRDRESPREG